MPATQKNKKPSKAFVQAAKRFASEHCAQMAKDKYVSLRREFDTKLKSGVPAAVAWAWLDTECKKVREAHEQVINMLACRTSDE